MIEDMREDFLEKELDKVCGACKNEEQVVIVKQQEEAEPVDL